MLDITSWFIAGRSLYNQGTRVLLAGLAIASATALFLALLIISDWTTANMRQDIRKHENNALLVFNSYNYHKNPYRDIITLQKLEDIQAKSNINANWTAHFTQYHRIHIHNQRLPINHIHTNDKFLQVYSLGLRQGRNFTQWDDAKQYFCLVGHQLGSLLQKAYPKATDRYVTINQKRYQVIGILPPQDNKHIVLHNLDNSIITLIDKAETVTAHLDEITFQPNIASDPHIYTQLKNHMQTAFPKRQFQIIDTSEMVESMRNMIKHIEKSLLSIGLISLVLSSFNIVNSMLASIYERREEIGIRLAIGAQPYHIRNLFLQEIILLCSLSATTGIILTYFGLSVAESWLQTQFPLSLYQIPLSFISCVMIGLIASYYPTQKAKNIKPIEVIYGH